MSNIDKYWYDDRDYYGSFTHVNDSEIESNKISKEELYIELFDHEKEIKSLENLLVVKDAGMKALEEEVERLKRERSLLYTCAVHYAINEKSGSDKAENVLQILEGGEDELDKKFFDFQLRAKQLLEGGEG